MNKSKSGTDRALIKSVKNIKTQTPPVFQLCHPQCWLHPKVKKPAVLGFLT